MDIAGNHFSSGTRLRVQILSPSKLTCASKINCSEVYYRPTAMLRALCVVGNQIFLISIIWQRCGMATILVSAQVR